MSLTKKTHRKGKTLKDSFFSQILYVFDAKDIDIAKLCS